MEEREEGVLVSGKVMVEVGMGKAKAADSEAVVMAVGATVKAVVMVMAVAATVKAVEAKAEAMAEADRAAGEMEVVAMAKVAVVRDA